MRARYFLLTAVVAFGCLTWAATRTSTAEPDKELKRQIEKAVDRGVAYLRRAQAKDGTWVHLQPANDGPQLEQNVGATAMCGIAMLESGVDPDDSCVQRAASVVRSRANMLTYTYAIAASIIFLDRISKGNDSTVAMLGKKLQTGQYRTGGWSYYCPARPAVPEDNSNTQFAVLALWISRRHGNKPEASLQWAEKRFRENQQTDGGWGYQFVSGPLSTTSPSMTLAGMLALAFGFGTKHKAETSFKGSDPKNEGADAPERPQRARPDLKSDVQVMKAKDYIARFMSQSFNPDHHTVYFLWTLERVCMIYGYSQFNGIEWYDWGARVLIGLQGQNGAWHGDFVSGPNCETAWALLFLRKANLVADLDIGESVLSGGSMKDVGRRGGSAAVRPPPKQEKAQAGRVGKPGEAVALKEELRTAVGERVEEILDLMEKTKNSGDNDYTTALAEAIPQVRAAIQPQVRRALQNRLQRLSKTTLQKYLAVDDKEVRVAALGALATKEGAKDAIPEIIPLLGERDQAVATAAHEALKKISGKDHGRDQAKWQKWWDDGGK